MDERERTKWKNSVDHYKFELATEQANHGETTERLTHAVESYLDTQSKLESLHRIYVSAKEEMEELRREMGIKLDRARRRVQRAEGEREENRLSMESLCAKVQKAKGKYADFPIPSMDVMDDPSDPISPLNHEFLKDGIGSAQARHLNSLMSDEEALLAGIFTTLVQELAEKKSELAELKKRSGDKIYFLQAQLAHRDAIIQAYANYSPDIRDPPSPPHSSHDQHKAVSTSAGTGTTLKTSEALKLFVEHFVSGNVRKGGVEAGRLIMGIGQRRNKQLIEEVNRLGAKLDKAREEARLRKLRGDEDRTATVGDESQTADTTEASKEWEVDDLRALVREAEEGMRNIRNRVQEMAAPLEDEVDASNETIIAETAQRRTHVQPRPAEPYHEESPSTPIAGPSRLPHIQAHIQTPPSRPPPHLSPHSRPPHSPASASTKVLFSLATQLEEARVDLEGVEREMRRIGRVSSLPVHDLDEELEGVLLVEEECMRLQRNEKTLLNQIALLKERLDRCICGAASGSSGGGSGRVSSRSRTRGKEREWEEKRERTPTRSRTHTPISMETRPQDEEPRDVWRVRQMQESEDQQRDYEREEDTGILRDRDDTDLNLLDYSLSMDDRPMPVLQLSRSPSPHSRLSSPSMTPNGTPSPSPRSVGRGRSRSGTGSEWT